MNAFKVVRNKDGKLVSAVMDESYCKDTIVTYDKDVWTVPRLKNSKLFAFSGLNPARNFIQNEQRYVDKNMELWECLVSDPETTTKLGYLNNVIEYWQNPNNTEYTMGKPPLGTIHVSGIKLTRKLYPYYKVVRVRNNRYFSARQGDVEYKLNETVYAPNNTKLFVFDSLDDAKKFKCYGEKIFACEVKSPTQGFAAFHNYDMLRFWLLFHSCLSPNYLKEWEYSNIKYTKIGIWADEVILRKEIDA